MKKNKSKKINYIVFFIGICFILFPIIIKFISNFEQTTVINNYKNEVSQMPQDDLDTLNENATSFNEDLYLNNSFDSSLSQDSISSIDFSSNNNILAYITIPKLSLELPIYEGCSDKVLTLGIGHLSNTSLPIGGKNTHSVLVGHTGLANSIMFDDLDKLKIGDIFSVTYLNNILTYEICQINVVEPNDTKSLVIKPDEDLVTLVTCTPKHINTHRLLVTGKRVTLEKHPQTKTDVENISVNETSTFHTDIPLIINIILIHIFIFLIIYIKNFQKL